MVGQRLVDDTAVVAKSVVISSGVIVDWDVEALAPVCDDAPPLDRWVGWGKAWTASDAVDGGNDAQIMDG